MCRVCDRIEITFWFEWGQDTAEWRLWESITRYAYCTVLLLCSLSCPRVVSRKRSMKVTHQKWYLPGLYLAFLPIHSWQSLHINFNLALLSPSESLKLSPICIDHLQWRGTCKSAMDTMQISWEGFGKTVSLVQLWCFNASWLLSSGTVPFSAHILCFLFKSFLFSFAQNQIMQIDWNRNLKSMKVETK